MNDPQEATIRAAWERAVFDERTAEEQGFALFFESMKPRFIENIGFNLRVAAALRQRRLIMSIAAIAAFLLMLYSVFYLPGAVGQITPLVVFSLVIAAQIYNQLRSTSILKALVGKRPNEVDPNQASTMDAILARFGCRLDKSARAYRPRRGFAHVMPEHTRMYMPADRIFGKFDGRIDFYAIRVKAERKLSKRTIVTFQGWFMNIELPFTLSGTTIIREHGALTYMHADGFKGLELVGLEDPVFSARYNVRATDQVEARVILAPDVMQHLAEATAYPNSPGVLTLSFSGKSAQVWMPSRATELSDWRPLDPTKMIEDLHQIFAELSALRGFLRDIDVIAESEGFRAQAARNGRS